MGKIAQQLLALNSAKHAIRLAINDKGGGPLSKGDPLSNYPQAIADIPSGGTSIEPGTECNYCLVVFIDWDGTVLSRQYVEKGHAATFPDTPVHDHLVFSRWTRTAADLESVMYDMCVGACYHMKQNADLGKTPLFVVYFESDSASSELQFRFNAGGADTYKLYLDGVLVKNMYSTTAGLFTATFAVTAGNHVLTMYSNNDTVAAVYKQPFGGTASHRALKIFQASLGNTVLSDSFYNSAVNSSEKNVFAFGQEDGMLASIGGLQNCYLRGYVDSSTIQTETSTPLSFNGRPMTFHFAENPNTEYTVEYNSSYADSYLELFSAKLKYQNNIYSGLFASRRVYYPGDSPKGYPNFSGAVTGRITVLGSCEVISILSAAGANNSVLDVQDESAVITCKDDRSYILTASYGLCKNWREFLSHFNTLSNTSTLRLRSMEYADAVEIAEILTQKGYTVTIMP